MIMYKLLPVVFGAVKDETMIIFEMTSYTHINQSINAFIWEIKTVYGQMPPGQLPPVRCPLFLPPRSKAPWIKRSPGQTPPSGQTTFP